MTNRTERMNKLNAMGINTNKYFTLDLPEGLKPGAKISLVINEDGQLTLDNTNEFDVIREQIIEDGYVRNTKLFRRFVMAQMFQMLNYKSWDGKYKGYNDYLKRYDYDYTITMMIEEVRVLSKLEAKDKESFEERSHFFTKDVVIAVLNDYMDKLKKYVETLPNKNCKGVPYKKIKGMDVFVEDLQKKVYRPIALTIIHAKSATNYTALYRELCKFRKAMIKLPYNTPKSKAWIDAYKGNGAFYTLKNLVMFHGCFIEDENKMRLYGVKAVKFIESKLDEYQGKGWRMFALMKKVIADNGINTKTYIGEICNK